MSVLLSRTAHAAHCRHGNEACQDKLLAGFGESVYVKLGGKSEKILGTIRRLLEFDSCKKKK